MPDRRLSCGASGKLTTSQFARSVLRALADPPARPWRQHHAYTTRKPVTRRVKRPLLTLPAKVRYGATAPHSVRPVLYARAAYRNPDHAAVRDHGEMRTGRARVDADSRARWLQADAEMCRAGSRLDIGGS